MTSTMVSIISCRLSERSKAYPPLGPMYVSVALEKLGYEVQLLDHQFAEDAHLFNVPSLVETIIEAKGDLVGISIFADALPLVLSSIRIYEAHYGHKTFFLGGPGVNGNEITILRKYPEVWAVIRGEGETTVPKLMQAFLSKEIPGGPGIYVRDISGTPTGTEPERIKNIDEIPWPNYSKVSLNKYVKLSVVTSRGCPFNCSFCEIITMWGRSTSFRSIVDVVSELKHLVKTTGHLSYNFIDDTFTLNKKRVIELCRAIIEADLNITWSCFSRIDTIDEDMLKIMHQAGCAGIFFGIDTGSELLWRSINKKLSRNKVLEIVGKTLQYCDVTASYIWGYPDEGFSDFIDTIHLAYDVACLTRYNHTVISQLHFLSPTRSTPIYEKHSHKLLFSELVPLEICGSELRRFKDIEGYNFCLELIKSDSELFAPYYHYDSVELDRKLAIMRRADIRIAEILGDALLSDDREEVLQDRILGLTKEATPLTEEGVIAMAAYIGITCKQEVTTKVITALPELVVASEAN